jgi:hypothetical protein
VRRRDTRRSREFRSVFSLPPPPSVHRFVCPIGPPYLHLVIYLTWRGCCFLVPPSKLYCSSPSSSFFRPSRPSPPSNETPPRTSR